MIEKAKKNLFFLSFFFLTIFWNKDKIKEIDWITLEESDIEKTIEYINDRYTY